MRAAFETAFSLMLGILAGMGVQCVIIGRTSRRMSRRRGSCTFSPRPSTSVRAACRIYGSAHGARFLETCVDTDGTV